MGYNLFLFWSITTPPESPQPTDLYDKNLQIQRKEAVFTTAAQEYSNGSLFDESTKQMSLILSCEQVSQF